MEPEPVSVDRDAYVVKMEEDRSVRETNGYTQISNSIDLFGLRRKEISEKNNHICSSRMRMSSSN